MIDLYSIKDAATIFAMQPSRLRYWAQTGFINPSVRRHGRMFYTFSDLVQLRAAWGLLDAGLTMQEVRKNLTSLRDLLPELAQPASAMRVLSDGKTIVARDHDVVFDPLSGQVLMDFTMSELSNQVATTLARPTFEAGAEILAPTRSPDDAVRVTGLASAGYDGDSEAEAGSGSDSDSVSDSDSDSGSVSGSVSDSVSVSVSVSDSDSDSGAIPLLIIADRPTEPHDPAGSYRSFVDGCAAEDRGDLVAAETAYRRAIEFQPTLAAAHTNLGILLYRKGDPSAARAAWERAIELEPDQPEARFNLGNVLEDLGEIDLAIAELRRVCWAHPDFRDAHYNLALLLTRVGGTGQARKHLESYLALDGESSWSSRARTLLSALP